MKRVVLALLILTVAGVTVATAQDMRTPAPSVPFITVEGSATRDVAPDLAVISLGVASERPTAADAAAQNNKAAAALLDEIKASGVADADIETTQVSLTPIPDSRDGTKTKGFRAVNHVAIRVHVLPTVGDIVGRLVDKGANEIEGIDFSVSDPQPLLDTLRTDATHDALHKARIFADAAGVKLGRILEMLPESSAPGPYARNFKVQSGILAAAPAPPVQAGTQTLEARVRVTLELVP